MYSSRKMTATPKLLQLIRILWPEAQEKGYSTMSNKKIAEQLNCSKSMAFKLVSLACDRKMIKKEIDWEGLASRKIYILEPQEFHKKQGENNVNKA